MRTLTLALIFFAQAQAYAPPFDRPGTTKMLENDRVIVWNVSWLKQAYPVHPHLQTRDAVVVAITGLKSRVTYVARGTVHNDEQIGAADRVFAFEVK